MNTVNSAVLSRGLLRYWIWQQQGIMQSIRSLLHNQNRERGEGSEISPNNGKYRNKERRGMEQLAKYLKAIPGFGHVDAHYDPSAAELTITLIRQAPTKELIDQLTEIITRNAPEFTGGHKNVVHTGFKVEFDITEMYFIVSLPPRPPQIFYPEPMPTPEKVSDSAMALLTALHNKANVRVRWRYHVPDPTVDGEDMPGDWWNAYRRELTREAEGSILKGDESYKFMQRQSVLTNEVQTYNGEDSIEVKIVLNKVGREFVERHAKSGV